MTDDDVDDVGEALQQAQQYHQMLDNMKEWSRQTSVEIRSEADVREELDDIDSDEADQLRQIAEVINSLYRRIEKGDSDAAKRTTVE